MGAERMLERPVQRGALAIGHDVRASNLLKLILVCPLHRALDVVGLVVEDRGALLGDGAGASPEHLAGLGEESHTRLGSQPDQLPLPILCCWAVDGAERTTCALGGRATDLKLLGAPSGAYDGLPELLRRVVLAHVCRRVDEKA